MQKVGRLPFASRHLGKRIITATKVVRKEIVFYLLGGRKVVRSWQRINGGRNWRNGYSNAVNDFQIWP